MTLSSTFSGQLTLTDGSPSEQALVISRTQSRSRRTSRSPGRTAEADFEILAQLTALRAEVQRQQAEIAALRKENADLKAGVLDVEELEDIE